jgi:hypothetical protein
VAAWGRRSRERFEARVTSTFTMRLRQEAAWSVLSRLGERAGARRPGDRLVGEGLEERPAAGRQAIMPATPFSTTADTTALHQHPDGDPEHGKSKELRRRIP